MGVSAWNIGEQFQIMPFYLKLYQHAIEVGLSAIFPIILVLLLVGLSVSIIQSIFQIEDPTFALLPKTAAMIILTFTGSLGAFYIFESLCRNFIINAPDLVNHIWY